MSVTDHSEIRSLISLIERATADYNWQAVSDLAMEGLESAGLSPDDAFELRQARVNASEYLGNAALMAGDLAAMMDLAKEKDDGYHRIEVQIRLAHLAIQLLSLSDAANLAQQALDGSRLLGNAKLEAAALYARGLVQLLLGEHDGLLSRWQKAAHIAHEVGDVELEVTILADLGWPRPETWPAECMHSIVRCAWREQQEVCVPKPMPCHVRPFFKPIRLQCAVTIQERAIWRLPSAIVPLCLKWTTSKRYIS
jgi:tetratricopeptide (TPR) repeat protein